MLVFFLMMRQPPCVTLSDTLFPYTTPFCSVLRSRMRRALGCTADVGCLGDVLRLAVEFGGGASQGVPVKAFNDHGDLRRTMPPPRRAAQHGVAHLLKGGFCQQSAGQEIGRAHV